MTGDSGRLKVVHLISDLESGGAQAMLVKLATRMDRERFEVGVVSLSDSIPRAAPLSDAGIALRTLGVHDAASLASGTLRLARLLRRWRPHLLHTWLYHADLAGLLAGRLARVPRIVWALQCSEPSEHYQRRPGCYILAALVRLSRFPDLVLSNSEAGRRYHQDLGYRARRWEVIPNGFEPERFKPDGSASAWLKEQLRVPRESLLVGMVARFDPQKDHHNFLAAAGAAARQDGSLHFVLVGRGVDAGNAELAARVGELGLAGRVHMLGERDDVARLTAAFDVAVSASSAEGLPNTVGEAMACAVPCVVTDVGDCRALVGEAGRVVPAGQPSALAAAVSEVISLGPEERARLGQAARRRIEERYDIAVVTERHEDLYRDLVLSGHGARAPAPARGRG